MIRQIALGASSLLLALSSLAFAADDGGGKTTVTREKGGGMSIGEVDGDAGGPKVKADADDKGAGGDGGELAVKVASVEEHRTRVAAGEDADRSYMVQDSEMTITCRVTGAAIAGATKYGKIAFTEAVDDSGTKLIPDDDKYSYFGQGDTFVDIHQLSWDRDDDGDGHDDGKEAAAAKGVDVTLHLNAAPRKAAKIASVKGQMQILAGGEKKVVSVAKINSMLGKMIEDPALKAAGVTVKVLKVSAEDTGSISLELKGSIDAISEIKLVDATGEAQSGGTSWNDEKGRRVVDVYASSPIEDATAIKIELMVGQKTVTVPFELKDIELP